MFMNSPGLPKGNLVMQKVVSFKCFETKEKSRLQLAYPFLSPEQIKGKVRDRWNKLDDEEKQNYITYKLDKTPVKKSETCSSKKPASMKKKRKSLSKIGPPTAKEMKLDIYGTPDNVNTQKLKDFRSLYSKSYKNDFSASSPSSRSSQSPLFKEDKVRHYGTRGNIGMKLKTPDCKKISTQGILKNSDSGRKLQKGKVSFLSPKETSNDHLQANVYQLERHRNCADFDFSDRGDLEDYYDDDDEEESFLIRREDTDFGHDTENNERSGIENKTRSRGFKDAETEKILHPNYQYNREKSTNEKVSTVSELPTENDVDMPAKFSAEFKENISQRSAHSDIDDNYIFKSPLPNSVLIDKSNTCSKKKKQTPDLSKMEDQRSSQITPQVPNSQEAPEDYTTPQMDETIQQFALVQALKAPEKLKQNKDDVNVVERMQARLTGRQVNRSLLSTEKREENMERDDSQRTVEKVRRIKKKSVDGSGKYSPDQTEEANQTSRVKRKKQDASHKNSKKMNKSVRSKQASLLSVSGPSQFFMEHDPVKDFSRENKDFKNNTIADENLAITDMNPSGDASGGNCQFSHENKSQKPHQMKNNKKARESLGMKNKESSRKDPKSKVKWKKPAKPDKSDDTFDSFAYQEQDEEASSLEDNSYSSPSYFSIKELTELKEKIAQKRTHNPALERTLKLLQLTAASYTNPDCTNSPADDEKDNKLSPQLLSPALSGVSELSSVSSSLSTKTDDLNTQISEGNGLCQLFTDITPPDQKTEGLYKTQRLLTSSSHQKSVILKNLLFEDEDIFT